MKHAEHVPQHRTAPARPPRRMPRRGAQTTLVLSAVAVAVAATAVATVAVIDGAGTGPRAALETVGAPVAAAEGARTAAELGEREAVVSRSDRRTPADPAKKQALAAQDASAMTASETLADDDPREIAQALMPEFGFSADQFGCLDDLWTKESGWDPSADNPTSSAYGIPQSLPGEKMASAGADWATNPATQIRWGLGYIQDVYGSPCSAWDHSQAVDWY